LEKTYGDHDLISCKRMFMRMESNTSLLAPTTKDLQGAVSTFSLDVLGVNHSKSVAHDVSVRPSSITNIHAKVFAPKREKASKNSYA
jgi:hypothetical protein